MWEETVVAWHLDFSFIFLFFAGVFLFVNEYQELIKLNHFPGEWSAAGA
jgi:hypothetical protein